MNIDVEEIVRVVESLTPEELEEIEQDGPRAMEWAGHMIRRYLAD